MDLPVSSETAIQRLLRKSDGTTKFYDSTVGESLTMLVARMEVAWEAVMVVEEETEHMLFRDRVDANEQEMYHQLDLALREGSLSRASWRQYTDNTRTAAEFLINLMDQGFHVENLHEWALEHLDEVNTVLRTELGRPPGGEGGRPPHRRRRHTAWH